jgi:hypothetical protein
MNLFFLHRVSGGMNLAVAFKPRQKLKDCRRVSDD